MTDLKIAVSRTCPNCFSTQRNIVNTSETNFIDVAAVVLTLEDIECGKLDELKATGYNIPVFIAINKEEVVPAEYMASVQGVFEHDETRNDFYGRQLEAAAHKYETELRPPFFSALVDYVKQGNSAFDCPGHQGGAFFRRHPCGQSSSVEYLRRKHSSARTCATPTSPMGDLLIHEGCAVHCPAGMRQKSSTPIKPTSCSTVRPPLTKWCSTRFSTPGDLVLFDRNNHKSNHHGALLQAGCRRRSIWKPHVTPYGFIGGIDAHCFDERLHPRELRREAASGIAPTAKPAPSAWR